MLVVAVACAAVAGACGREAGSVGEHAAASSSSAAGAAGADRAQAELARLDARAPDLLTPAMAWQQKQRMMAFLTAVQQIVDGTAADEWDAVVRASAVLGTSPDARPTCGHPPPELDAIGAMALEFRCRADGIGASARARDRAGVLRAMGSTLAACNACHAAFRQHVVDEPTWRARRGAR